MNPKAKTVKEELGRCKAYFSRNEELRCLTSLAQALKILVEVKLMAQEKTEIDGLLRDAYQNVNKLAHLKKFAPTGLPFLKGDEKKMFALLVPVIRKIDEELKLESLEAARARKLKIDQLILKGQKYLAENNLLEAQRAFREAVGEYVDEKGLFPYVASKLIEAGHFKASLEYLKRAVEEDPENDRAFDFLSTALEKSGEFELGEKLLLDALKKIDNMPLAHLALAQARLGQQKNELALASLKRALELDPELKPAKKLLAKFKA